ncbi:uncharacterized protein UV8b_07413 [Ustilaginoidea virens]|uniref:Uncharacterized protein n=1 Tax=Ustilaginoidea virens TaxID=1159556 RepID=A0A8E5HXA8_USTVR|nr:uncharacterized protein UV8b_07413 [Ustilaginoidea virens]QUC23172.1 hypothetical protein UV8b_07413 [Ustilaginoidea virens]
MLNTFQPRLLCADDVLITSSNITAKYHANQPSYIWANLIFQRSDPRSVPEITWCLYSEIAHLPHRQSQGITGLCKTPQTRQNPIVNLSKPPDYCFFGLPSSCLIDLVSARRRNYRLPVSKKDRFALDCVNTKRIYKSNHLPSACFFPSALYSYLLFTTAVQPNQKATKNPHLWLFT